MQQPVLNDTGLTINYYNKTSARICLHASKNFFNFVESEFQ